jgi:hypothetical protein
VDTSSTYTHFNKHCSAQNKHLMPVAEDAFLIKLIEAQSQQEVSIDVFL